MNGALSNIRYGLLDAVKEPFPETPFDVAVWDGALAHFSADGTGVMLSKIKAALAPEGIFAGSESLGPEGDDHLQVFADLEGLSELFRPLWRHVLVRELRYPLQGGFVRREAVLEMRGRFAAPFEAAGWRATGI